MKYIFTLLLTVCCSMAQIQVIPMGQGAFNDALIMEQRGDLENARIIYESILETNPKNRQSFNRLKNVLKRMGKYDAASTLIGGWLEHSPHDLQQQVELGEVLYLNKNTSEARKVWSEFILQYNKTPSAYRLLIHVYNRLGLSDEMETLIKIGRENVSQPAFMALDLGNFFQSRLQTYKAVIEFLLYAKYTPNQKNFVLNKLLIMSDDEDQIPFIETALIEHLSDSPPLINSILSALYFKIQRYDESLNYQLKGGLDFPKQWNTLMSFANNLRKEKQFDLSVHIYELLLEEMQKNPEKFTTKEVGNVLLGLGTVYEDQIQPSTFPGSIVLKTTDIAFFSQTNWNNNKISTSSLERALNLYNKILTELQASAFSPNAYFRLGEIQYNVLKDIDGAKTSYLKALSGKTDKKLEYKIHARLIDIYSFENKQELALGYLQDSIPSHIKKSFVHEFLIQQIRLHLLNLEIDTVITLLDVQLMEMKPSHSYFNDFMEIQVFLDNHYSENDVKNKEVFLTFLRAEHMATRQNFSESVALLSTIRNEYPQSSIAIISSMREILLQLQMGRIEKAIQVAKWLQTSSYADKGYILSAEIAEYFLNDTNLAMEYYQTMLNDYPKSILFEPVRRHVRKLRDNIDS